MYLQEEEKKQKVLKALRKAIALLEMGKLWKEPSANPKSW